MCGALCGALCMVLCVWCLVLCVVYVLCAWCVDVVCVVWVVCGTSPRKNGSAETAEQQPYASKLRSSASLSFDRVGKKQRSLLITASLRAKESVISDEPFFRGVVGMWCVSVLCVVCGLCAQFCACCVYGTLCGVLVLCVVRCVWCGVCVVCCV